VQQAPESGQPAQPPETDAAAKPETQQEPKGVLRLLAAGHFKGVADVRLRINFADQLPDDMPALSPATENGAAYAKFLAIYNDLNPAPPPAEDAPTEPAGVPAEGEGPPPDTEAEAAA